MKTSLVTKKEIDRKHYLIDAENQILGRLAVKAALLLSGKRKVDYTSNVDNGDFVVIVNAAKVAVTGNKLQAKTYTSFSGYPGGFKIKTLERVLKTRPSEVIRHAVKGMIPKNKLGSRMITRLKIYAGTEHPHAAQKPVQVK
jgi:ribosomal protein L13, bacterial type